MSPASERALTVVALVLLAWTATVSAVDLRRHPGWHDFTAMCRGIADVDRGDARSAYAPAAPTPLAVTYPVLVMRPLQPLCSNRTAQYAAWIVAIVAATIAMVLAFPELQPIVTVLLCLSAFRATTWILWTGNIAAVEFLLISLAVLAFRRDRGLVAAVLLGVAGFVRLLPLAFVPVFASSTGRNRLVLAAVLTSAMTFAVLHLASALLWPDASIEYWRGVLGGFGGVMGREAWYGSTAHPSLYSAALAVGRRTPSVWVASALLYLSVAAVAVTAFIAAWRRTPTALTVWAGMVLVLLLSPRLKPYNLAMAIPAACAAAAAFQGVWRIGLLIVVVALPFAAFAATGLGDRSGVLGYAQLMALAGLYTALLRSLSTVTR